MGIQKTQKQFIEEMKEINPNIEVLGVYKNNKTKILCRCKIDGYEWEVRPDGLIARRGCPRCGRSSGASKSTKREDVYDLELSVKHPNLTRIESYVNTDTKILHRCSIDGYIWSVRPHDLLRNSGCPFCSNKVVVKGINDIATTRPDLVKYYTNKEDVYTYSKGSEINVELKCPECGYQKTMPTKRLSKQGFSCNKCGDGISYSEKLMTNLLYELQKVIGFNTTGVSKENDYTITKGKYKDWTVTLNDPKTHKH